MEENLIGVDSRERRGKKKLGWQVINSSLENSRCPGKERKQAVAGERVASGKIVFRRQLFIWYLVVKEVIWPKGRNDKGI